MKKILLAAAAALTALVACQKNEVASPAADSVLYATIEETDATKTYMDSNINIRWSEGDQIVGFMKSSLGLKYRILSSSVGKTSAFFEKVSGGNDYVGADTEWDHNIVYYPYSSAIEAEKSGNNYALNIVLPSEQTYASESFGNGSMAMVAVSEDNDITFRNILGGMKLQLKGTQNVKSIKLEGNNNEKLSGAATVTAYTDETKPAITMAQSASTSVTLDCGSGVQLNESSATEFIIALTPVLFSSGFTVTVIDTESNTYTVGTDKTNTVIRSSLLVMPPVKLGAPDEDEPEISSIDYIDEYGVNHGKGVKIGETVWAPVNCGYHATDFKYGKLYQWGRKYGQGYSGSLYDVNGNKAGKVSDARIPTIEEGEIDVWTGNHGSKSDIFFTGNEYANWVDYQYDDLWNAGTESSPVKTRYDPCPEGWRVPTCAELRELSKNHSSRTKVGYWFSGASTYTETVPQVFFHAAGYRSCADDILKDLDAADAADRGYYGYYWSSSPDSYLAYHLRFGSSSVYMSGSYRADGYSVRCVQATDEVAEL